MTHKRYEICSTHLPEFDEQHEEIFRSIKSLLDACRQGTDCREIVRAETVIENQASAHFIKEEECMIQCNYAGYEDHKSEHQKFLKGIARLKRQIETDCPDRETVIEMNQLVANWLVAHISRMDMALVAFLKNRSGAEKSM